MTQPAKARRHFIAWSPKFERAFYAATRFDAIALVCIWRAVDDGPALVSQEWRQLRRAEGWRVTEVSE